MQYIKSHAVIVSCKTALYLDYSVSCVWPFGRTINAGSTISNTSEVHCMHNCITS